ncbi:MAG TPA: WhiB family transcriptional regulator [Mycobacteriales bacterium]|nr:WhiB family transcriptional regulator [Mycobacteriales bacterium]
MEWTSRGACLTAEPEQFFPVGSSGISRLEVAAAKAICDRCPVMQPCRDYALQTRQAFGVWGGMDEEERRILLTSRSAVAVG